MSTVEVYLGETDTPRLVGLLRPSFQGRALASSSFQYDVSYLASGYALSPDLPLQPGRIWAPEHSTLFGAFTDASPDEWGQRIILAARARAARSGGRRPNAIGEFDYLLGVSDLTRMGALRFREPGSSVFQLRRGEAAAMAATVESVVDGRAEVARKYGIREGEIRAMSGAFDSEQRDIARSAQ